ncbi:hypothetical protein PF003_g33020 [Phytophthora fragariae]|nr:hypothetical protein PF003_g33020 [Phytophthora fragariae]
MPNHKQRTSELWLNAKKSFVSSKLIKSSFVLKQDRGLK